MIDPERTCESCKWWNEKLTECRRHSPVYEPEKLERQFPKTWANDFCGDYQQDILALMTVQVKQEISGELA